MKIGFEAKRVFHNKTGLGNYSRDLVRIMASFYPENKYLLYNPKKNKKKIFTLPSNTVEERLPRSAFHKKFYNIWRQKGIVEDLKIDKISIFHGLSGEIPSGLKQNNIKSVVTIHDLIFMRYPNLYSFWDRKIHYLKFKKAAKKADLVIAISEQTKVDIVHFLKVPESKIKVIYQGCQSVFKQNYTEAEKKSVRQQFQLPNKFVLNVGTIEERKNALTIVKSVKDLDTTLVLIGKETAYCNTIKEYIAEHNLTHKVLFLKGLSSKELAIVYQLSSVFVYPSLFEGFGIPIVEALYSKTPVITNKFGVFHEAGGPHSIYIDPMDSNEMAQKITFLLKNEVYRNEITAKGWAFVQKFDDAIIATEIMSCYQSLES